MRTRAAVVTGLMLSLGLGGAAFAQRGYYGQSVARRYGGANQWQAEQMVRQAYRDILGREPDPSGMQEYTSEILYRGWSDADVRRALLDSPEYAQRGGEWRARAGAGAHTADTARMAGTAPTGATRRRRPSCATRT